MESVCAVFVIAEENTGGEITHWLTSSAILAHLVKCSRRNKKKQVPCEWQKWIAAATPQKPRDPVTEGVTSLGLSSGHSSAEPLSRTLLGDCTRSIRTREKVKSEWLSEGLEDKKKRLISSIRGQSSTATTATAIWSSIQSIRFVVEQNQTVYLVGRGK